MSQAINLFQKHEALLNDAIKALYDRGFWTPYPEHPKAYGEGGDEAGKTAFGKMMNEDFSELLQNDAEGYIGEEISPYLQLGLGIRYPKFSAKTLLDRAESQRKAWGNTDIQSRAGVLIEALDRVKSRFFEIAYATMHTTGQSFIMSFQASGPHANDRALEAIAVAFDEMNRIPKTKTWVKPMGKFDLKIDKNWKPVPKGIAMAIGCSTFPTWNTVPGMFASLMTGNPVIVKPHPKAILPIAIVVAEVQKALQSAGLSPDICQLAVDTLSSPITKELAESPMVKIIDYTGSSAFGEYVENLPNKTVFTEKAGVNSCLIDSVTEIGPVVQNLAFAISLYSGQMCTTPQNFFIPEGGVKTSEGVLSFDEVVNALKEAISGLVNHPKMGAGTLGGIQAEATMDRLKNATSYGGKMLLESAVVTNPEFESARVASPVLIELTPSDENVWLGECFGPIAFVIKTKDSKESLALMKKAAAEKGAITCGVYSTDESFMQLAEEEMNEVFTPVSFNFTGAIFVNQHAAFSDFHVTGGNAAGNASFANADFVNRRFVWVGNRRLG